MRTLTDPKTKEKIQEETSSQNMSEFLESSPPNQKIKISDLSSYNPSTSTHSINTPEIKLHCSHEACNGTRFFRCVSNVPIYIRSHGYNFIYVTYICSNCQETEKIFSLGAKLDSFGALHGVCYKFGEFPAYGPPVPPRLLKLIGPDREEFLNGRRCENQGLGIGAFIYYRVVR